MNYRLIYDPIATLEYKAAANWYAERSEAAANKFAREVTRTISIICSDPFRYRNTYRNYRETSLRKFPYSIIYFVDEAGKILIIQSVFHHKRNPRKKYKRK